MDPDFTVVARTASTTISDVRHKVKEHSDFSVKNVSSSTNEFTTHLAKLSNVNSALKIRNHSRHVVTLMST